ncbi:unnamed protein product [Moneuplotes crassus]|uniref:Uncharacterized protein n=1 Tax=Euplotes crassus TaxID=5936 RepID=A0AAD1XEJ9_EUPCR|nr:unnamed protein product [Moneuplotes crassus]
MQSSISKYFDQNIGSPMNRDIDCLRDCDSSNRSSQRNKSNTTSYRSNKLGRFDFENLSSDRFKIKLPPRIDKPPLHRKKSEKKYFKSRFGAKKKPKLSQSHKSEVSTPIIHKGCKVPLKLKHTEFKFKGQQTVILQSLKALITQQKKEKKERHEKAFKKLKVLNNISKKTLKASQSGYGIPEQKHTKLKLVRPPLRLSRNTANLRKKDLEKKTTNSGAKVKKMTSSSLDKLNVREHLKPPLMYNSLKNSRFAHLQPQKKSTISRYEFLKREWSPSTEYKSILIAGLP